MVRILNENDRATVLDFLSAEPSINLFIIGDIENYGFQEDFQTIWGQFTEDGILEGVLLKYHESFIPYFKNPDFDITEFSKILLSHKGRTLFSGKESLIRKFEQVLPPHTLRSTYFCELATRDSLPTLKQTEDIKIATEEDSERVQHLMDQIEEFMSSDSAERIRQKIRTRQGRVYYIENEEGVMVSIAQTSAENSKSAMIVGVATLPDYRCKGYMTRCMTKLCQDIMAEGKTLCLFYDNPKAGKIYHRLGFKNIDNWAMISLELGEG